jgi:hypothetical protein
VASGCARGNRFSVKARVSRSSLASHLKRLARLGWYWQQASAVNDEVSGSAAAISIGGGQAVPRVRYLVTEATVQQIRVRRLSWGTVRTLSGPMES